MSVRLLTYCIIGQLVNLEHVCICIIFLLSSNLSFTMMSCSNDKKMSIKYRFQVGLQSASLLVDQLL